MIQPGHNCISSALATAPEKARDKRSSKDEEIQRGSVPCAEDDGVVFSSVRVTHKAGAAAAADAENASVWLTGTLGQKKKKEDRDKTFYICRLVEDRWK